MPWIKVDFSTPDKAEIWAIASTLDIDPDAVIGKLIRLWIWFDEHTENGNAPSVTKNIINRHVGVIGFCDAVIEEGWMLDDGKVITLPNFDTHNGETAKKRAVTNKRVAKLREKQRSGNARSNAGSNAPSVTGGEQKALPEVEVDIKENKKEKSLSNKINFKTLPEEISLAAAEGFVAHRKLIKKPMTQRAFDQAMEKALEGNTIGLTPDQVLDETVQAGWQGINLAWLSDRIEKQNATSGVSQLPAGRQRLSND